jgi:DNA (cytosine-5)-methyltransferase 1
VILELFGGPGGLSEGAHAIGLDGLVAIELDAAACATRVAAGHRTIRADVAAFDVSRLAGKVTAVAGSPPCVMFSAAGKRAGVAVTAELSDLIRDMFAGKTSRSWHRHSMVRILRASGWQAATYRASRYSRKHKTRVGLSREQRSAAIWKAVRSASLVAEPARYIAACDPEWVTLEQVPAVLPLWRVYAAELRSRGYSAWCGVCNAADYGVPQTRERAILIASRVRTVRRPEPTHYDPRKGMQLWGTPWVSMAEALGWGATGRPVPTVTAGGTRTGGAEPFGHRDREALEAARDSGEWALRIDAQENATCRPVHAPAGTIKSGHSSGEMRWVRTGSGNGYAHDYERPTDEPSPTVTHRADRWVMADPRIGRPGHKGRESGGESHFAVDSVRITPEEAAALQSFPRGYPFTGSKTKVFEQIGNAVPPLLAAHILAEASGARITAAVAVA